MTAADAYAVGATYAPHGPLSGLQFGNGLAETIAFNTRQQPGQITLGIGTPASNDASVFNETYNYGSQNNGNVQLVTLGLPQRGAITTAFSYDKANRLRAAMEDGGSLPVAAPYCPTGTSGRWCQAFSYGDRGNRVVSEETGLGARVLVIGSFGADNRVNDAGWDQNYDSRGNLKAVPIATGAATKDRYLFDAEDRMRVFCPSLAGDACTTDTPGPGRVIYDYDAEGRRVRRSGSGVTEAIYVYNGVGQLAVQYGGEISGQTGVSYVTPDRLGSTRVVTNESQAPVARYDYLPFGETMPMQTGSPRQGVAGYSAMDSTTPLRFTGKERDAETGLDWFGTRYMSSAQGRFTSPDKPFADQDPYDPQSWNLYSYARNNPLRFADPTGMCVKQSDATKDTAASDICQAVANLKTDTAGKTFIKEHEGVRLDVYQDTGKLPTVGYGHLVVSDDKLKVKDTITQEKADSFFEADLPASENAVRTATKDIQLSQNEFDALADLTFNVGPGVFTETKSPGLMKAIKNADYPAMSEQLRYTKDALGNSPEGLSRRSDERKQLFLGTYKKK